MRYTQYGSVYYLLARARDEAMAERAKQACEMAPSNPTPAPQCNCPGGSHKGFTGCPLNADPRFRVNK